MKGQSEIITPAEKAALLRKGIGQFNAGQYFDQHETFEHLWRNTPSPERDAYQAILQVGVAYLHVQNKNWDGAKKVLGRAIPKLQKLPNEYAGINLAQLLTVAQAVRNALESSEAVELKPVVAYGLLVNPDQDPSTNTQ